MSEPLLIIGIGNNSRGDDGLGWAFLDAIHDGESSANRIEYRYQLLIEDAELLTHFPRVLFVDACETPLPGGFSIEPCAPDPGAELYTHQQTPGAILFLGQDLYGHRPEAWRLLIQGYEWDFEVGLSERARENLQRAVAEWRGMLV